MGISFRHSAGFGKRTEYNPVGQTLMEGLDVYLPLVDDHGVDGIIKKEDGTFIDIQIKARSNGVTFGEAGLSAANTHDLTPDLCFIFYPERPDSMWMLSPAEFLQGCVTNKTGRKDGKRSIWFNGRRTDKNTGEKSGYCFERFDKYRGMDFSGLH